MALQYLNYAGVAALAKDRLNRYHPSLELPIPMTIL